MQKIKVQPRAVVFMALGGFGAEKTGSVEQTDKVLFELRRFLSRTEQVLSVDVTGTLVFVPKKTLLQDVLDDRVKIG